MVFWLFFSYMHITFSVFGFCFDAVFMFVLLHACYFFILLCWTMFGLHVCLSCLSVRATSVVLFWCCFHVCFLTCMLASHFSVSNEVLDFFLAYRVSLFMVVLLLTFSLQDYRHCCIFSQYYDTFSRQDKEHRWLKRNS